MWRGGGLVIMVVLEEVERPGVGVYVEGGECLAALLSYAKVSRVRGGSSLRQFPIERTSAADVRGECMLSGRTGAAYNVCPDRRIGQTLYVLTALKDSVELCLHSQLVPGIATQVGGVRA